MYYLVENIKLHNKTAHLWIKNYNHIHIDTQLPSRKKSHEESPPKNDKLKNIRNRYDKCYFLGLSFLTRKDNNPKKNEER